MQKKSFIQTLTILMRIQLAALSLIVILFAAVTIKTAENEMDITAENFLNVYAGQLANRIAKMDENLSKIIYNDTDLKLLESDKSGERVYASIRLAESLNNIMYIDGSADMLVIAEASHDTCLDARSGRITYDQKNAIREFVMEYARGGTQTGRWEFEEIGGTVYLYKCLVKNQRAAAVLLAVPELLATVPDIRLSQTSFVLTDDEDIVWGDAGNGNLAGTEGVSVSELSAARASKHQRVLAGGQVKLYSFESRAGIFRQFRGSTVLLFAVILLLLLFDVYFVHVVQEQMVVPMNEMTKSMRDMIRGDYEFRIGETGDSQEFFMLAQTFNKLMDEIMNLKIRFYEKKLELQDAEQKYIRLQIRPHFFLNALTSISSLSAKSKNKEIEIYIGALSKNIRYMFSSGLHTVSVKEEIRHVENYLEMQELKYPGCLFSYIDMPGELGEWKIPQMLIHTIVENEYKYAVSTERTLMLLIKVSTADCGGEEMLAVEIEDDGRGYPQEVLEMMGRETVRKEADGTRVGLWSVKRLLELMYDKSDLMELSNIEPHGAKTRFFIPAEPVHEMGRESWNENGIR